MQLTVFTTAARGTVYLDIVREGQTVSTRALEITAGKAVAAVDLTPDLYGTLEMHAYKVLNSGSIARDTRLVVVSQAEGLNVSVSPEQDTYLPGDTATLNIQVNGDDREGVPAAVGLAIVDEAVFALAESDPGFARLYFLLEKEIMQPRYDLHGYSLPELMRGLPAETDAGLKEAVSIAAQASLSEVSQSANRGAGSAFSLSANSHIDAVQRAEKQRADFFNGFSKVVFGFYLLLPLVIAGLSTAALLHEKNLGKSLLLGTALIGTLFLFFVLMPPPDGYYWGGSLMDRFMSWIQWLGSAGETGLLVLLFLVPVSFLALVWVAVKRRDAFLGWTLGLLPLFLLTIGMLAAVSWSWSLASSDVLPALMAAAFFILPLALLLRFSGLLLKRRFVACGSTSPKPCCGCQMLSPARMARW
jgi:hypothetical protein